MDTRSGIRWMVALAAAAVLGGAASRAEPVTVVASGVTALPDALEGTPYAVELEAPDGLEGEWAITTAGYSAWTHARVDEASGEGQAMGWRGDEWHWRLELPFAFPFYGQDYTEAWVGSNGTIEFGSEGTLGYNASEESLKQVAGVAVMWADLDTSSGDIYVASNPQWVDVTWKGAYYGGEGAVSMSARLYPDGRIGVMFGEGNARGGLVGVSGGPGFEDVAPIIWMDGEDLADTVFAPFRLPEGLEFDPQTHKLATGEEPIGEAGLYAFGLSIATGVDEEPLESLVSLRVSENPAVRPVFTEWEPQGEAVNLAEAGGEGVRFSVMAVTTAQAPVAYRWYLDGEQVGSEDRTFVLKEADLAGHTLAAVASADGLKDSRHEWAVGVLRFTEQPQAVTVSMGQRAELKCGVEATGGAKVTWYRVAEGGDEQVGTGTRLVLEGMQETATCFAVASSAYGEVKSEAATVTVSETPVVGQIYKLTGPAFAGNRLVLRAKAYGNLDRAEFTWTRDGKALPDSGERLDIASLKEEDFGTYRLLVRTPAHQAWVESEPYVLSPAPSGAPLGWGADDHGRTTAPEGLTGVAAIASGMNFNVALTTNGTVTAWGYDGFGACDVPEGLAGVSSVAAGGYQSCGAGFAVKTDGTVTGWGQAYEVYGYWDDYAQWEWDEETGEYRYTGAWVEYQDGYDVVGEMPDADDLGDVVQMAVGGEFAVALRSDGSVKTWSEYGEMDENPYEVPAEAEDVVAVAAGAKFVLALRADGRIVAWGDPYASGRCLEVPENLGEALAVAATKDQWSSVTAFAVLADGASVAAWGQGAGALAGVGDVSDVAAIDAGQTHVMTLSVGGEVQVWSRWNDYGEEEVPAEVAGAVGIAAGGYHCTAILLDTDGDTIPDTLEPLYGRDPEKWEDWHRTSLTGTVTVDGGTRLPEDTTVSVYDAAGHRLASAEADPETGLYTVDGLIPGRYFVFAESGNAVDDWAGHVMPPQPLELSPDSPWTLGEAPVAVGLSAVAATCDFDLAPGQAHAWCKVVPVAEDPDADDGEGSYVERPLPEGSTIYLDLWPVEADGLGRFDLGEVAASHALSAEGMELLPHIVTYKDPENPDGRPAADNQVRGAEGYTVAANPVEVAQECSVRVSTGIDGVEVWVDRADESLGMTDKQGTLDVYGLAAGSHALLLRKEGYLRPRPIEFVVEPGEPTDIDLDLHAADGDVEPLEIEVSAGLPETPIYLDYLPTGLTTPATVGGMDPTLEEGWNWRSVSHSILLRREGSRPYAPRIVPDDAAGKKWDITGPNQFDDDDNDGVRNDHEVAAGHDPADASNFGRGPLVSITNLPAGALPRPIRVPVSWVSHKPAFHGRFQGLDSQESRIERAREILGERAANRRLSVLDCFIARLDPTDPEADFRMAFTISNSVSFIAFHPCFAKDLVDPRSYEIVGTTDLVEATTNLFLWATVSDPGTDVGTISWSSVQASSGDEVPAVVGVLAEDLFASYGNPDGATIGWVAVTNTPGGAAGASKSAGASSEIRFYRVGVDLPEEYDEP